MLQGILPSIRERGTMAPADDPGPAPARHRAYVGPALIAVCVLHITVGVVDAGSLLLDAAADGWAGAFTGERAVAMWFLMTGVVGVVAGLAITFVERSGRLPWTVSISLLVAAAIGVSMAPTSGFVLVLAVAILAVIRSVLTSRSRR